MDRFFGKMWIFITHGQNPALEVRFFRLILLAMAGVILLFTLPTNLLQDLSPYLNWLITFYGVSCLAAYYCSYRGRHFITGMYLFSLLVGNVCWFLNAGSSGSIVFYFFAAGLYAMIFFRGRPRQVMFLVLVLNVTVLYLVDYYFPHLVIPYKSPSDRLLDMLTGFLCSLLACVSLFWVVISSLELELEERKRAERSIAKERDRAQGYLDTVETVIVALGSEGEITTVNRKACQLLGYREEELLGRNWFDVCLLQPEGRALEYPRFRSLMAGEPQRQPDYFEVALLARDGARRQVVWHYSPLRDEQGGVCGALCSGEDITERKQAEQALRESEERFRSLVEGANDIVFTLSCDGRLSYLPPNWQETFGYEVAESFGRPFAEFLHPDDAPACAACLHKTVQTGKKQSDFELRLRHRNGGWIWYSVNASLLQGGGQPTVMGIGRDISKRKEAEAALRESEQALRLKSALLEAQSEATLDAILVLNEEQRRVFVNRRFSQLLGVPAQLLEGEDSGALFSFIKGLTRDSGRFLELMLRLKDHPHEVCRQEVELASGSVLDLYSAPVLSGDGRHYGRIWTFRDITDQKRFEVERLKIEKLESLGILAGGIAHDFNNILAGIMGGVSLAQAYIDPGHAATGALETAEKAAVRAADLARQLITFAKGGEPVKAPVSARKIIDEAVSLALRGSNVKGVLSLPESLHAIDADEGQIGQVFNNLVINAKQAMPAGGTLTIAAINEVLPDRNPFSLPAGNYVKVVCSDTGHGIAAHDLGKIFDPYFTTKTGGTGLGLASVYSILHRHGGDIAVSSEPGQGATFTVYLPACAGAEVKGGAQLTLVRGGPHGGGSILVMDDELLVRDLADQMLSHLGYRVCTCQNGEEAIQLSREARQRGTPFRAIIMDLTVPGGMGGREAAGVILKEDPQACLIVSSGYSDDPVMADHAAYGFQGSVSKPYTLRDLGQVLSAVLGDGGPAPSGKGTG